MNYNRLHIIMMFVLACTVASLAQDGTNAYNYLSVPVSSHVYAVGGHNLTIIDDDINLVEQNPALMGGEIDKQVGLNYMRYLGGSNFMGARYGQGIGEHGAFAVGIQHYGYGSMEGYDITGVSTGKFSASDLAFNVTYSHDINDYMRGGITVGSQEQLLLLLPFWPLPLFWLPLLFVQPPQLSAGPPVEPHRSFPLA